MLHLDSITARIERLDSLRHTGLLAFACGLVSVLSLAPIHLFIVLFATLPIFWILLSSCLTLRRAFELGFLFGFGYFLGGLWWVGSAFLVNISEHLWLLPIPILLLPAFVSLYWGAGAALTWLIWSRLPRTSWLRVLVFASVMTLVEFLRGILLTGFPWNLLGYALMPAPIMMQTAGLIGTYGMTFLAFFVFSLPSYFVSASRARRLATLSIIAVFFAAHLGYGWHTLRTPTLYTPDTILRVVQPNINQEEKWAPGSAQTVTNIFLDLSTRPSSSPSSPSSPPTHFLWPESSLPFFVAYNRAGLAAIDNLLSDGQFLVLGAVHFDPEDGEPRPLYNSVLAFDSDASLIGQSRKRWLVPLGEFLPFRDFFRQFGLSAIVEAEGDFEPATSRASISLPNTPPFVVFICYEAIYPGDTWTGPAEWILNPTNDDWFGRTHGPYQHAHQSRIRGVESGLPVIRVANSGISFATDSYGRLLNKIPLGARDTFDVRLPVSHPTFFGKTRNFPIVIFCCLLLLGVLLTSVLRSRHHRI